MDNKNNHLQKNSSKELQTYVNSTVKLYNTTLKVRDFAADNKVFWSKTRMILAKCSLMLGSKTAPTDEEYFLLKEALIKSFKDFSPEEIEDSFDKLVAGKLNLDVDKYGKVTVAYLGQILIASREYRNKELAKELKNAPKAIKIATDEDKAKIRAEFLETKLFKPYSEITNKGEFSVDLFTAAQLFRLFKRVNLLEASKEDGEHYEPIAIKSLQEEYKSDVRTNRPIANFWERMKKMEKGQDKALCDRITDRCQALFFMDYIMKLHKNNRDIKEIAKQL